VTTSHSLAQVASEPNLLLGVGLPAEPASLLRIRFFCWSWRFGWFLFLHRRLLFFWRGGLWFRFLWLGFGFFPLCFFLFRRLFLGYLCHINPLDECHRSRITLTLAKLHDARVPTIAFRRSRRDTVEQFFHSPLLVQRRQSSATRVDGAFFSQRDHPFRE